MKILTYATHETGYFLALTESLKRYNYDLIVLGQGDKWYGLLQKLVSLKNYLSENQSNEVICFVDAYDVIFLDNPKKLEQWFLKQDSNKVYFSATRDNFTTRQVFSKIASQDRNKIFNRLNSGCFIGFRDVIYNLLCDLDKEYDFSNLQQNDQEIVSKYYSSKKFSNITLDCSSEVFYNLEWNSNPINALYFFSDKVTIKQPLKSIHYKFNNNKLFVKKSRTYPIVLHGNGNANLDSFTQALELPSKNEENRNYYGYSTTTYFNQIKYKFTIQSTV